MFVHGPFESRDVVKLVGVPDRELRHWCDTKVLLPDIKNAVGRPGIRRQYSFENLVEARMIKCLLGYGVTHYQVSRILEIYRSSKYRQLPKPPGTLFLVIQENGQVDMVTKLGVRVDNFLDPNKGEEGLFVIAVHAIRKRLWEQVSQIG